MRRHGDVHHDIHQIKVADMRRPLFPRYAASADNPHHQPHGDRNGKRNLITCGYFMWCNLYGKLCTKYRRHTYCRRDHRIDIHRLVRKLRGHVDEHFGHACDEFNLLRRLSNHTATPIQPDDQSHRHGKRQHQLLTGRHFLWCSVYRQLRPRHGGHIDSGRQCRLDIHRLVG